jgi:tRNA-dihydrouridine synthase 3
VLWRFVELLRDHFGDDERGRTRTLRFLPWHLGSFCRYRPFPEAQHAESALRHPLLQTRLERDEAGSSLESLLRDARPPVHEALAAALVASLSREEALELALRLQATLPAATEVIESREPVAEVAG